MTNLPKPGDTIKVTKHTDRPIGCEAFQRAWAKGQRIFTVKNISHLGPAIFEGDGVSMVNKRHFANGNATWEIDTPAPTPVAPEGRKDDSDKPRWDLLIEGVPRALEEVVNVLTYGSRKYADHNWQFVANPQQRYLAAGMRHEAAVSRGEAIDPETNLHHLAHKLCCDLFRLELLLKERAP